MIRGLLIAVMLMLAGCSVGLPRHEWTEPRDALWIMSERSGRVRTIAGSCRVLLREAGGPSVSLDGAVAARAPDHFRLRAWKVGRPVLDVTISPDGVWVLAAERAPEQIDSAVFKRVWEMLTGTFGDEAEVLATKPALCVRAWLGAGATVTAEIDPNTLTARRYEFAGPDGAVVHSLTMDRYGVLSLETGAIVWPRRVIAEGAEGRVTVLFDDIEFNGEPAPGAFVPPRRAVRRP